MLDLCRPSIGLVGVWLGQDTNKQITRDFHAILPQEKKKIAMAGMREQNIQVVKFIAATIVVIILTLNGKIICHLHGFLP